MPMLGFKDRFTVPVLNGTKRQTIRKGRKSPPTTLAGTLGKPWARWWGYPPAAPGEMLILSAGVRTREYRELKQAPCKSVKPIVILFAHPEIVCTRGDGTKSPAVALAYPTRPGNPTLVDADINYLGDDFARADGFNDLRDMVEWFARVHKIEPGGRPLPRSMFIGWLVTW